MTPFWQRQSLALLWRDPWIEIRNLPQNHVEKFGSTFLLVRKFVSGVFVLLFHGRRKCSNWICPSRIGENCGLFCWRKSGEGDVFLTFPRKRNAI